MIKIDRKNLAVVTILLFALIASLHMWQKLSFIQHSHFTDLAFSFLQGKFTLPEPIRYSSWQDSAYFKGRYYVYFGPIPAIFLLPAVVIWGQNVPQQILSVLAGIANFLILYKLAQRLGLKKNNSLWLGIAFLFGSVYLFLSLVNISSYLIQVIGFTFLAAALYEFFAKKRWLLLGALLALAGMTRPSLYLASVFFVLEALKSKNRKQIFLQLALPIILSVGLLGIYNQARFGNPFDTGYTYNPTWPAGKKELAQYGLFSLKHIPGNLYLLFLKGPEAVRVSTESYVLRFPFLRANEWGMGIFFTSPFFLYLFLSKLKKKYAFSALLTSAIGILPALFYAGTGVWQFGYRYALDIYPFLFVLLALVFTKGMPLLAKFLIVYSIFFNLFLMGSIWGVYPF